MDKSSLFWKVLYRYLISPLALFLFWFLSFFHKKIRRGFQLRQQNHKPSKKLDRPIWIHCASGEFEYAKPIIQRIKKEKPEISILVTYFSPSSKKSIESFPGVDFACPTPWETQRAWKRFLNLHCPRALLIARTDIWPEMIFQASSYKIPTLLFSATLVKKSRRMNIWARSFYKSIFPLISQIFCVSEEDKKLFEKLGAKNVSLSGDTRFEQVFERLAKPKPIKESLFKNLARESVFLAGSSWLEDEKVFIPAFAKNLSSQSDLKMIVAPHEPTKEHLSQLQEALEKQNLSFQLYSKEDQFSSDVLIIDQVGILAELYTYASVAFVGGSFRKTVHSVMEPLAAGCSILLGPLFHNNREALEFEQVELTGLPVVQRTHNPDEFEKALNKSFANTQKELFQEKLVEKLKTKSGGTEAVLKWLGLI